MNRIYWDTLLGPNIKDAMTKAERIIKISPDAY